jgi:hypothetical protein
MKKLSRSATFTVFVGLGLVAFAQTPRPRTPPSQQTEPDPSNPQAAGQSTTVTGCLMKGTGPGEYAITDKASGEKLTFAAPDQLQRYVNQTVQLTGTMTTRGGEKAFRPESVKSVSPSC